MKYWWITNSASIILIFFFFWYMLCKKVSGIRAREGNRTAIKGSENKSSEISVSWIRRKQISVWSVIVLFFSALTRLNFLLHKELCCGYHYRFGVFVWGLSWRFFFLLFSISKQGITGLVFPNLPMSGLLLQFKKPAGLKALLVEPVSWGFPLLSLLAVV